MNSFANRRFLNVTLAFAVGGLLVLFNTLYEMSLRDAAFLNGWLLFAGMVFLTLFNARKKLPFMPLMAASTWLQIHVYLGLICALLFLLHSDFRLPNGTFEILLWATTVGLFVTGMIGLVISRRLPLRLRSGGERIAVRAHPVVPRPARQRGRGPGLQLAGRDRQHGGRQLLLDRARALPAQAAQPGGPPLRLAQARAAAGETRSASCSATRTLRAAPC